VFEPTSHLAIGSAADASLPDRGSERVGLSRRAVNVRCRAHSLIAFCSTGFRFAGLTDRFGPKSTRCSGMHSPGVGHLVAQEREQRPDQALLGGLPVPADVFGQLPDALDIRLQRFAHGPTLSFCGSPNPGMDRHMSNYADADGSMREGSPGFFHFPRFPAEAARPGPGDGPTIRPAGSSPGRPLRTRRVAAEASTNLSLTHPDRRHPTTGIRGRLRQSGDGRILPSVKSVGFVDTTRPVSVHGWHGFHG
jgi:hypothetical protein